MCIAFRWSKHSKMPSKYAHLSQRGVKDKILSQYIEKYIPQQPKVTQCWKCGEIFHEGLRYCPRCGSPVSDTDSHELILKQQVMDKLLNMLIRHPHVREEIIRALKERHINERDLYELTSLLRKFMSNDRRSYEPSAPSLKNQHYKSSNKRARKTYR